MRQTLKVIAIAFLILMMIQPKICATGPIFDIVLCSDTIRFNKGENFEIIIYFIGLGDVTEDYLLFYVNDEIYVKEAYIMGGKVVEGLQDRGTNMQRIDNLMPLAKPFFIDYSPDSLNPLHSGTIKEGCFIPPMNVTLITGDNVSSGEHTIKAVYMYKGEDDVWHQASDIMNFHVTTEVEEIEYEFLMNERQFSQLNQEFANLSIQYQQLSMVLTGLGTLFGAYVVIPPLIMWCKKKKEDKEEEKQPPKHQKQETSSKPKQRKKQNNEK